VRTYLVLSIVLVAALVTLCALFSLSGYTSGAINEKGTTHADILASSSEDGETSDDAEGSVDLFGNDVTEAVARYRFDATGSLYEVHSPQTEIPKLAAPKS
jgi:hypothetical protein